MCRRLLDAPLLATPTSRPARPAVPARAPGRQGTAGAGARVFPPPRGKARAPRPVADGSSPPSATGSCCTLTPAQAQLAAAMSEDTGHGSVEWHLREYLKFFGLALAYHPWRQHTRRAREGFPDWVIAGPGGTLFRELKRQAGKLSAAQAQWLETFRAGGLDAAVWRPCCVLSGRMARELAVIARRTGGAPCLT